MREVKYHNPIDYLSGNIFQLFDVFRNSKNINSIEDFLSIGFLFLSLHKDGLLKQYDLKDKSSFEKFRKDLFVKGELDSTKINYKKIFTILDKEVSNLENAILQRISFKLFEINREILFQNFSKVFDNVLYLYASSNLRTAARFLQPIELTRFMYGLADLKEAAKVFNPFAGLASFGVQNPSKHSYYGQELNQKIWVLGILRLMAFDKTANSKYECVDSILHWPNATDKFDFIVSNPPFRLRLENQFNDIDPSLKTIEQLLIVKGLQSLNQHGKLVTLLPETFLNSNIQEELNLRKFLVDEDLIDTIISLPSGILPYTAVPIIILFLNKKKNKPDLIRFIKADDFVEPDGSKGKILNDAKLSCLIRKNNEVSYYDNDSFTVAEPSVEYNSSNKNANNSDIERIIESNQIKEFDYNINVPRYFQKKIDSNKNEDLVKLDEILSLIEDQKANPQATGKLIRIRNLKNDKLDYLLNVSNLEVDDLKGPSTYQVSESCLLLAMRWRTLKPTYFEFNGEPIYRKQDILSYKVDDSKVDIAYLIHELHADYVLEQLDSFRSSAAVMPVIRKVDLMKVVIKLPSLKEQKAKMAGINEVYNEQKVNEAEANYKKQIALNEIEEQNNFLRHAIAGNLANLRGSFKKLKNIFENQIKHLNPEILAFKENEKSNLTLEKLLLSMELDIEKVSLDTQRNSLGNSSINDALMESIEIIPFISDFVNEVSSSPNRNFEIEFTPKKEDFIDSDGNEVRVFINGNKNLLRDMFNNIIENAVEHAFESEFRSNNLISIDCFGNNTDEPSFSVSISNNGKRLPQDFTHEMFIRKGSKAGPKAGNGFGGWYINQIINKHKGSLEIDDEQGPQGIGGIWSTSFEISLPVLNYEKYD
jgi:type I restriction enzyme M protein